MKSIQKPRKFILSIISIAFSMGAFLWVQTLEAGQTFTLAIIDDSGESPSLEEVVEVLKLDYGEEHNYTLSVGQDKDLNFVITSQEEKKSPYVPLYLNPKSHFLATFTVKHVF